MSRFSAIALGLSVLGIFGVLAIYASTPTSPIGPTGNWALAFNDEFDGTSLDTSKWDANWYGEGGSMNNVGTYAANTKVSGGNAILTLASSGSGALIHTNYTSGRYTLPVGSYVEARVQFAGSGSSCNNWAAWWASGPSWPSAGEHDIAEVLSGQLTVNYHSPSGAHNQGAISGSWCGGFHTYGLWRKAGSAEVYWDGVKVKSYTTDDNGANEELIFNVGNGSSFGTSGQMLIDWVRAWKPSSTPFSASATPTNSTPTPTTATPTVAPGGTTSINDATTGTGLNQFNFSGSWATSNPAGAFNTDNHYSNATGDYYTVQFSGTQTQVYSEKNSDLGIVGVSIDGGTETMVDPYAAVRAEQQLLYTSPVLTNGTHTVKVRITGNKNASSNGTYASADRVDVISGTTSTATPTPTPTATPTPTLPTTTTNADINRDGTVNVFDLSILLNDWGKTTATPTPTPTAATPTPTVVTTSTTSINDATTGTGLNQFNFSGSWATSNPAGAFNTDNHYSNATGDYYTVQFSGTQTQVYSEKNSDLGIVGVSIDGGTETMVDPYAAVRAEQQLLYTSPSLVSGTHTLKVRITGNKNASSTGTYASADRVDIISGGGSSDTTSPTAPTGLTATAVSAAQVNLSWTGSTDNVGVDHYNIVRGGVVIATASSTARTYSDISALPGTTYSYVVKAVDAALNESAASNTATVTTPASTDTTPPSTPAGLTATAVSGTQVNLSWNASSDNVGVAGYQIFRGGTQVGTSTGTTYGDAIGLTAGTTYSYTVKAIDSAGNLSAVSNTATVTTPGGTTPTPTPTTPPSGISSATPCGVTTTKPTTYKHVIWIFGENHPYESVINNSAAPYITSMAQLCGSAKNYSATSAPSRPNYIAATSGSDWGIADNNDPTAGTLTVDNIFRQVRTAGGTAKSFQESMPGNCYQSVSSDSLYKPKHNPAAYYTGGSDRTACNSDDLVMGSTSSGAFASALASESTLPTFSLITPNMCNDAHDCSVGTHDAWMKSWLPKILDSPAYKAGNTVVMYIFDEANGSSAGTYSISYPDPTIMFAPSATKGKVSTTKYDHYSLLRTTEEMLGLPLLQKAATAPSMRNDFNF